jgi:hypothetical protein
MSLRNIQPSKHGEPPLNTATQVQEKEQQENLSLCIKKTL